MWSNRNESYSKVYPQRYKNNDDIVSNVCSKEAITGSYDMEDFPQVFSFDLQKQLWPLTFNYEFYKIHDGITKLVKDLNKKWGLSLFYEIVLNSCQMLSWKSIIYDYILNINLKKYYIL